MDSDPTVEPIVVRMHEPARVAAPRPLRSGMLLKVDQPTVRFYRYLSTAAAGYWPWTEVRDLADEELRQILDDDGFEFFALYLAGEPVGCFELEFDEMGGVEIVQMGTVPEHRGGELEKYLLWTAVETAWDHEPERVWARLDVGSDARSLLLYQRAGFDVTGGTDSDTDR
ncbi:GNAT family N-acetyltransferase [bacterium]|nr:GNAT family N-acetyltransferase [bacterium]